MSEFWLSDQSTTKNIKHILQRGTVIDTQFFQSRLVARTRYRTCWISACARGQVKVFLDRGPKARGWGKPSPARGRMRKFHSCLAHAFPTNTLIILTILTLKTVIGTRIQPTWSKILSLPLDYSASWCNIYWGCGPWGQQQNELVLTSRSFNSLKSVIRTRIQPTAGPKCSPCP